MDDAEPGDGVEHTVEGEVVALHRSVVLHEVHDGVHQHERRAEDGQHHRPAPPRLVAQQEAEAGDLEHDGQDQCQPVRGEDGGGGGACAEENVQEDRPRSEPEERRDVEDVAVRARSEAGDAGGSFMNVCEGGCVGEGVLEKERVRESRICEANVRMGEG